MSSLISALDPHLVQTHASPIQAVSFSVSLHALYSGWFRGHCFLVSSIHSDFRHFVPFPPGSLSTEEWDLKKESYFCLNVPKSLTLWILPGCGSLYFFPICFRRKVLWWRYWSCLSFWFWVTSLRMIFFLISSCIWEFYHFFVLLHYVNISHILDHILLEFIPS